MPYQDPVLNVLDIFEKNPLPQHAILLRRGVDPYGLQALLCSFVRSDAARGDLYAFFTPDKGGKDAYRVWSKHVIIPTGAAGGLESFTITTSDRNRYMSLILGAQKWGIDVPANHAALMDLAQIESVTVENRISGHILQDNGYDYSIFDHDIRKGYNAIVSDDGVFFPSELINCVYLNLHKWVKWVMFVVQIRHLRVNWKLSIAATETQDAPPSIHTLDFTTECLWYPPFGNKHVVKYLRSALQGAIGQVTDPLRLADIMIKCEVAAPRLREVLFETDSPETQER